MDRTHLAAACFLGAAVSMFTLLFGFTSMGAWIVIPAALLGGVSAWLSYKPRQIMDGLRYAAKQVPEVLFTVMLLPRAFWSAIVWLFKRPQVLTLVFIVNAIFWSQVEFKEPVVVGKNLLQAVSVCMVFIGGYMSIAVCVLALLWTMAIGTFKYLPMLGDQFASHIRLSDGRVIPLHGPFWTNPMSWSVYIVQMLMIALGTILFPAVMMKICWSIVKYLFLFAVLFLKFTHSSARIICMIDGPLGGFAGFGILFALYGAETFALPLWMQGLSVLTAGVLGAVIGIVNDTLIKTRVIPRLEVAVAYLHPDRKTSASQT